MYSWICLICNKYRDTTIRKFRMQHCSVKLSNSLHKTESKVQLRTDYINKIMNTNECDTGSLVQNKILHNSQYYKQHSIDNKLYLKKWDKIDSFSTPQKKQIHWEGKRNMSKIEGMLRTIHYYKSSKKILRKTMF